MKKVRYKCGQCGGFIAETDGKVKIQAYCKKCREIVEGVEFKRQRPRITKEN